MIRSRVNLSTAICSDSSQLPITAYPQCCSEIADFLFAQWELELTPTEQPDKKGRVRENPALLADESREPYSSSIWLYIRLSWISYRASIASITEAGLAWARTVTSGDSSMTLLMATESTGGICRRSARVSISSSFRCLEMRCILFRRAHMARWIRLSVAVMCAVARLACAARRAPRAG